MEDVLDILCINCQEMINFSNILEHSLLCVYPSSAYLIAENNSALMQIQYRLDKLVFALDLIIFKRLRTEHVSYEFLLKQAKKLYLVVEVSIESVERCNSLTGIIKKFAKSMIKPGLIIYSERLRELASEKTALLIESLAKNGYSEEIIKMLNKKYTEIIKTRTDASETVQKRMFLKNLSENLQNIDEIASQVSRVMTQRSSTNSLLSPDGDHADDYDLNELDNMNLDKEKEQNDNSKTDLHKYFYSKCLMIKLSFSSDHPSKYIQIQEVYKKILAKKVPMEMWEQFIKEEFNHPERWVNPALLARFLSH